MDPLFDSPALSERNQPRSLRELYLAVTGIVGFVGTCLLAMYSLAVYQAECMGSLGFLFPVAILGSVAMLVCGLMTLAADSNNRWKANAAAIVSTVVIPVVCFAVVVPMAARYRVLRHTKEMEQRLPLLNEVVALTDASKEKFGHVPIDEAEFYEAAFPNDCGEDHWEVLGTCCWGIFYGREDSEHYRLRYEAIDVLYRYDSRTPERGWYPASESDHENDTAKR